MNMSFTYPGWPQWLLLVLFLGCTQALYAQDTTDVQDTARLGRGGGGRRPPTAQTQQGQGGAPQPKQEGQVNFQAKDSLTFDFKKDRIATLYGSASVNHSAGQLKAGKVAMNLDSNVVSADTETPQDTLSQPVLIRQDNRVRSKSIKFNYKTEQGRFEVARVNVQDGNLIGTRVKNTSPHVIYLKDAIYSTCQLDHPHYYIKADRMKIVDREKVFFQNARLFILDIPYPIVFPFGYLPGKFDKKQSGLLQPTYAYQDRQERGIGLQNVGWFQYFNDYLTGQISGDIFTSGSYYLNGQLNYKIRNQLNGDIQLGYSKNNSGLEPTDPNFTSTIQKSIRITHNQQFSPYANINASINLRTADYYKENSYDLSDRAKTSASSNINYHYRNPSDAYSLDLSINQNRDFINNRTRISGPTMDFRLQTFSPFSSNQAGRQETKWYETISVGYSNSFDSNYEFNPIRGDSARIGWFDALLDPSKYRQATGNNKHYQYGFRQDANIRMNQVIPSQFLNVNIGGNYTEYWFPTTTRKTFNADSNEVVEHKVRGFTTARDFSANLNFQTTVYGLMNLKIGDIQSFRHVLKPNLQFTYSPNFRSDFWGYYRTVQSDTTLQSDGTVPTQRYSIFENEVYSGPTSREQRRLSFGLSNRFEAKRVHRDSTGEKKEEVIDLIDALDMNTSYNFAADSLKLDNLQTSIRASILPGLSIRANADFNFYERNAQGQRIDKFLIAESGKPLELTSFSTSTSYSFQWGDEGLKVNDKPHYPAHYNPLNQSIFHPVDPHFNDRPVQDFNSPFSFSVDFSYRWNLNPNGKNRKSATINARNITMRLTPKWHFRTEIGYDFVRQKLTPSQFSLNRNLHCWDISFTMNPFGDNKYYFFSLKVNAGRLQSIFQKLPGLNNLQRSSSTTGRAPAGF